MVKQIGLKPDLLHQFVKGSVLDLFFTMPTYFDSVRLFGVVVNVMICAVP